MYVILHTIIAPAGPPRDVTPSTTSGSVSVSWSTIDCIERNGVITNYTVVFQEQGGVVIPSEPNQCTFQNDFHWSSCCITTLEMNVMDRNFTVSGLTPHTNYTFRVAGVNSNGTGPYSNVITVVTDEDG